jgi:hypothetical protein
MILLYVLIALLVLQWSLIGVLKMIEDIKLDRWRKKHPNSVNEMMQAMEEILNPTAELDPPLRQQGLHVQPVPAHRVLLEHQLLPLLPLDSAQRREQPHERIRL